MEVKELNCDDVTAKERYFYRSLCTHTTIAPSPLHLRTFVLLTLRPKLKDESVRVEVAPMEYHTNVTVQ